MKKFKIILHWFTWLVCLYIITWPSLPKSWSGGLKEILAIILSVYAFVGIMFVIMWTEPKKDNKTSNP